MTETGIAHPISDMEAVFAFLAKVLEDTRAIKQHFSKERLDLDMYAADPGGVVGVLKPPKQYNGPYIIESILATWTVPPQASFRGSGTVTSPGANQVIAQTNPAGLIPPGEYDAYIVFNLAGTVAQGVDSNNIKLVAGSTVIEFLENNIGTNEQTFGPIRFNNPVTQGVNIQTVAAGTVGSIYSADITLVPVGPQSVTLTLGADRVMELPASAGFWNPQDMKIQLAYDDPIVFTIVPPTPCFLEIFGYADERRTDTTE